MRGETLSEMGSNEQKDQVYLSSLRMKDEDIKLCFLVNCHCQVLTKLSVTQVYLD